MKLFAGTSAAIALVIILFFVFINEPGATIFLCPAGLIALWVNGFAASRFSVRISIQTSETPTIQPATPAARIQKPVRRSEFQ